MKVVLITGAASGLGWALTQGFLKRGDAVVMVDLNGELLGQREAELQDPASVLTLDGDITDTDFQSRILQETQARYGRLDILVNNAGITHRSRVQDTDPAVFDKVMAVDWQAPVRLTVGALPMLGESKGMIINIGSMAGWMPVLGRAAYCAAKSALAQFFEVLRGEVAAQGIDILNVYPSFLDTPIEQNALGAQGGSAGHARSTVGKTRGADWMAAKIIKAAEQGRPWLFPDRLSWFGSVLWRLWPSRYQAMMQKRFATELEQ